MRSPYYFTTPLISRLLSNRTANDLIANILCALPSGIVVARYRAEHLRHHRAPNTEFDPYALMFKSNPRDWNWPKRPSKRIEFSCAISWG